jgi:hypothetical protein
MTTDFRISIHIPNLWYILAMDKEEYNSDDAQLAQMGHKSELKRNFSLTFRMAKARPSIELQERTERLAQSRNVFQL